MLLLSRPLLAALFRQLVRNSTRSAVEEGEAPMLLLSPTELLDQQRPEMRRAGLLDSRAVRLLLWVKPAGGSGGGGGVAANTPGLLLRAKQLVLLLL